EHSNNALDVANVDDVLFGIKERPLVYYENGGGAIETDYKVLLNERNNKVLYMGKIYSPIHNQDIIEAVGMREELKLVNVRNYYGKRFEFTYTIPHTKFQLGPEETMFSLNIVNSYDGTSSLHVIGGLYVLICSNGAQIGRMTYQFKRKHTVAIGRNEIAGFVQDSLEYLHTRTDNVSQKQWSDDKSLVKDKFNALAKVFPERKDQQLHPSVMSLNAEYMKMERKYTYLKEFALFMAATNMTTRPEQYGLCPSYTKALDNIIGNVFFN
ncbi:MAG: DUF932 domain-containing protein, partial [bacterium]